MLGLFGIGHIMARRKSHIEEQKIISEITHLGIEVLHLRREILLLREELDRDLIVRLRERNNAIMDEAADEIRRLRRIIQESSE